MSEWISVEDSLPKEGETVLLLIVMQSFYSGSFEELDVFVTGGIKDGDWFAGNDRLLWDFDYNLGFTSDDVTHWKRIDAPQNPQFDDQDIASYAAESFQEKATKG